MSTSYESRVTHSTNNSLRGTEKSRLNLITLKLVVLKLTLADTSLKAIGECRHQVPVGPLPLLPIPLKLRSPKVWHFVRSIARFSGSYIAKLRIPGVHSNQLPRLISQQDGTSGRFACPEERRCPKCGHEMAAHVDKLPSEIDDLEIELYAPRSINPQLLTIDHSQAWPYSCREEHALQTTTRGNLVSNLYFH